MCRATPTILSSHPPRPETYKLAHDHPKKQPTNTHLKVLALAPAESHELAIGEPAAHEVDAEDSHLRLWGSDAGDGVLLDSDLG